MKGLHHVGITVKDLDASIRFYHDILGLSFSNEPSPWFDGEELGPAVGAPRPMRAAQAREVGHGGKVAAPAGGRNAVADRIFPP